MHYEEARQLSQTGPWNWTTINDRVSTIAFPIPPCLHDGDRCDHRTSEEAERHRYEYELSQIRLRPVPLERRLYPCDMPTCSNREMWHAVWPGGYRFDSLCDQHANLDAVRELVPFVPGLISVHS